MIDFYKLLLHYKSLLGSIFFESYLSAPCSWQGNVCSWILRIYIDVSIVTLAKKIPAIPEGAGIITRCYVQ